MLFEPLTADEIGFREAAGLRLMVYTPVMHGVITVDESQSEVYVRGLANWAPIAFLAPSLNSAPSSFGYLWLIGALACLYIVQAWRYSRVTAFLRAELGKGALGRVR